jgi:hypothetical protein
MYFLKFAYTDFLIATLANRWRTLGSHPIDHQLELTPATFSSSSKKHPTESQLPRPR